MTNNIVQFRGRSTSESTPVFIPEEPLTALVSTCSTLSSKLLLEGLDKLERAIAKLAHLVHAMPEGEARWHAEAELSKIYCQLTTARTMSRNVSRPETDLI